jgi:hypothetical protein
LSDREGKAGFKLFRFKHPLSLFYSAWAYGSDFCAECQGTACSLCSNIGDLKNQREYQNLSAIKSGDIVDKYVLDGVNKALAERSNLRLLSLDDVVMQ